MITRLYKNTVELEFDEARHRFTVDGKPVLSVTACTSVIDKSQPLIIWAVGLARDYLLGNLKELAKDTNGEVIARMIGESAQQHRIKKEQAATLGTMVHEWAEKFIKAKTKKDIPLLPKDPKVYNGVTAFLKWVDEYKVKFLASERHIYSKKYGYAGIMDAEAMISGEQCVVDFKTSKNIYPEFRLQVAAYQGAAEEESGIKYADKWIVKFDKESGEFEAHQYGEHEKDYKAFLAALALRKRLRELDTYKK